MARNATPGVLYRHSRECLDHDRCKKNCNSSPTPWQAWVYDAKYVDPKSGRRGKKIVTRWATHAAAKGWRNDAAKQVRDHTLRAAPPRTLNEEIEEWLDGARAGRIRNKREQPYKPAVLRNYELALRRRVQPVLGDRKLADLRLADLLDLKEQLQGAGQSDSTIRNTFVPLQAIFRRARRNGVVATNPALDLGLPSAGSRDRAAMPTQAAELLAQIGETERALWATAFYAGLRRGELRALRVRNVDLEAATISVVHGWDDQEGEIAPKSRPGTRVVFLLDALRPFLTPLVEGRDRDGFVFGRVGIPFEPRNVDRKARRAWDAADAKRKQEAADGGIEPLLLERFTLHEARHSFSTWLDHAGVSPDRADRYMGHSSGSVASRYRHLLPGQITEDSKLVDAYLAGAATGKVVPLVATARVALAPPS
jgi:integrase